MDGDPADVVNMLRERREEEELCARFSAGSVRWGWLEMLGAAVQAVHSGPTVYH